jgi:hypothetical protein
MSLGFNLLKILKKKYGSRQQIDRSFRGNDMTFVTDEEGNPVQLYIGKRREDGSIKGERYTRVLKKGPDGIVQKDHWDLKGKC